MKEITNLVWRSVKFRFQNPVTIIMTMVQPLMWLLLFTNLFNRSQNNYMGFMLSGILVMSILFSSGMSGIANYYLKRDGSYYRIMISPIKRISIVIAHSIDAIVLSGIQVFTLLIISFLFGTTIHTGVIGVFMMFILIIITIFFVSTLSYLLSISIPDENGFIAIINTFTLPLFFLTTALLEKEAMPSIFQVVVSINPFTYVVNSLRNIIIGTSIDWQLYGISIFIMAILAIILIKITSKKIELN